MTGPCPQLVPGAPTVWASAETVTKCRASGAPGLSFPACLPCDFSEERRTNTCTPQIGHLLQIKEIAPIVYPSQPASLSWSLNRSMGDSAQKLYSWGSLSWLGSPFLPVFAMADVGMGPCEHCTPPTPQVPRAPSADFISSCDLWVLFTSCDLKSFAPRGRDRAFKLQETALRHCTPLCPQVFHLPQAKQDVAAGVLVCHQHCRQQRLHPVQNVRRLPREEVQPGSVWRETCQGVAGPGGCITSPLRLCWPRGGRDKEGACHLPACWRAHCVARGSAFSITPQKGDGLPRARYG